MWPESRLCTLLSIDHPIVLAPMAGPGTPAMAAAVTNAGGLGSLPCARLGPDELRTAVRTIRDQTNGAFALNFFAHRGGAQDAGCLRRTADRLAPFYAEFGLGAPRAELPDAPDGFDGARLDLLLEMRPPVASFHFGLPSAAAVAALKRAGIVLIATATSVAEARAVETAGMDAVVAQGFEAGGHRGSHRLNAPGDGIGTMALIPQIADAVTIPVIAAGGIADGRGIAAAFALGADGVQIGTSFLLADEAATPPPHRAAVQAARDDDTVVTAALTGRPARARRSRFADAMRAAAEDLPPFPTLMNLTMPLLQASGEADSDAARFEIYGQAAALARAEPAAVIFARLLEETRTVFSRLG